MNKKSKIIILILVILVILGVATHLFLTPNTVENSDAKNITDMLNRSVQIPASTDSVVATSPPMTTVIYMIAPDKLNAVNFQWTNEELKYVPSQYANFPVVGGWYGTQDGSYEEFIASEPDLIIESIDEGNGDLATVEERQEKFGSIPVIAVKDTTNIEKMGESILFMGEIVGAEDSANALNDFNNKYLDKVHQKSQLFTRLQQILKDDAAVIVGGYYKTNICWSENVTGVTYLPVDYYWITKDIKPAS